MTAELLGPLSGLALSLLFNILFYNGRILPRNAVPREDLDKVLQVNADNAKALSENTETIKGLVLVVKYQQRNGDG